MLDESLAIGVSITGIYTRPHDSTEAGSEGPDGHPAAGQHLPGSGLRRVRPGEGRQLFLTGSADTEDAAIVMRDQLRAQVRDNTAARTNVTLSYLLDEWLAGHQVEETTRASYC